MKKILVVLSMVLVLASLTGCGIFEKKPIKVTNKVSSMYNGQLTTWEDTFYILDGQIVDEDGNPIEK